MIIWNLRTSPRRRGFTLTELLISVAIALVLVLGIARVFQLTGDTIGVGTALSTQTRDQRAAQTVMTGDFAGLSSVNPGLAIWSGTTVAYVDRETMDADAAFPAGKTTHRTDRIGMFVTGEFARQTGNDGYLTSDVTSEQAYVWYGHLKLPDNSGQFFYGGNALRPILPGSVDPTILTPTPESSATNPNNFFAKQWALGRVAMLLKNQDAAGNIVDKGGTAQVFINDTGNMAPLEYNSPANSPMPAPRVQDSRYDLGGFVSASVDVFPAVTAKIAAFPADWFNRMDYRFQCDPIPVRPLDAAGLARTVPMFLPGCTDFIVEFAGDFDGDGIIDFDNIDPDGTGGPMPPVRQTRWYGFPRDSDGDNNLTLADVVPVKWRPGFVPQAFERNEGDAGLKFDDRPAAYPGSAGSPFRPSAFTTNRQYVTAWTAEAVTAVPRTWPQLIRIVYTTRDANGRLRNPQPIETVFKVN